VIGTGLVAAPVAALALVLAGTPASYLAARLQPDGGFAEPGGHSALSLTAWATLGLAAAGHPPGIGTASYLHRAAATDENDLALKILALRALGERDTVDADRLVPGPRGRIGPLVDSTIWSVLALRSVGRPVPRTTIRYLLRQQRPSGGWSWYPRGAPDSNDTAAALEALRAAGVRGRSIRRGVRFLLRFQNRDGGFELTPGRGSDSQSTAWAIQGLLAAGRKPPASAFRYLARMRRPTGSYRYSARYAITPVWVTAQVLPALARKSFPLTAP
jgi:hypothetical protein